MSYTTRPPKRRRTREPILPPPLHPDAATTITPELAASLSDHAHARILQSVGFTGATRVAQESLRAMAENFMLQMTSEISRFAHAQRRTRPTVVDFQQMLHKLSLPLSSLEREMQRMPTHLHAPTALSPPPPQSSQELDFASDMTTVRLLLGEELDGGNDHREYIPDHLPPFPSQHTYLTTPVFTERPREPRVIREMATQEAVLAENALRKILAAAAGAGRGGGNKRKQPLQEGGVGGDRYLSLAALKKKRRDEVWEKTFNAVKSAEEVEAKLGNGVSGGENIFARAAGKGKEAVDANVWLEVIVNSDTQYWRRGGAGKALKGRQQ